MAKDPAGGNRPRLCIERVGGFSRNPRDSGPCISRTKDEQDCLSSNSPYASVLLEGEARADEFSSVNESPSIDEMKKQHVI